MRKIVPATSRVFAPRILISKISTLFAACALAIMAGTALGLAEETKELDLRTDKSAPRYTLTLSAENSTDEAWGHAFASFAEEGQGMKEAVGFYPPGNKGDNNAFVESYQALFSLQEGQLINDSLHHWDYRIVVTLDKASYEKARAVVQTWRKPPPYFLAFNDCTTFVGEIADAAGLETPVRALARHPQDFLKATFEKTQKRLVDAEAKRAAEAKEKADAEARAAAAKAEEERRTIIMMEIAMEQQRQLRARQAAEEQARRAAEEQVRREAEIRRVQEQQAREAAAQAERQRAAEAQRRAAEEQARLQEQRRQAEENARRMAQQGYGGNYSPGGLGPTMGLP